MKKPALLMSLALGLFLLACPSDPPANGGNGSNGENGANGANGENGGNGGNGGADAGPAEGLANGAVCDENEECASGFCLEIFFEGTANGYCSRDDCAVDADCDFGDGKNYQCFPNQQGGVCVRTCDDNDVGCGDEDICFKNAFDDGAGGFIHICADFTDKNCDNGQADCAEGLSCTYFGTGFGFINFCGDFENIGELGVGEACDPFLGQGNPCDSTDDCEAGVECDLESGTCQPPPSMRCAAYFCLDTGFCGGPCSADADCPTDYACRTFELNVDSRTPDDPTDDGTAPIRTCFPMAGSLTDCTSNADCTVADEYCVIYNDASNTEVAKCRAGGDGAAVGETCADDPSTDVIEPQAACGSQVCYSNECTTFCNDVNDCPNTTDYQCVSLGDPTDPVKICSPGNACTSNADCAAGSEFCGFQPTLDGPANRCVDNYGDVAAGGACTAFEGTLPQESCIDDSSCSNLGAGWWCDAQHNCQPPRATSCEPGPGGCLASNLCTAICEENADCPTDWTCGGFQFRTSDNNTPGDPTDDPTDVVNVCFPYLGSLTSCDKNADCTTAGETCRPMTDDSGNISGACMEEVAGGAAEGAACGRVDTTAVTCINALCDFDDGDGDFSTGTCASFCAVDGDCSAGLTCQDKSFSPTTEGNVRKVCRKPGSVDGEG
jgi:hypothetical protein